jgi:hypothetical protein
MYHGHYRPTDFRELHVWNFNLNLSVHSSAVKSELIKDTLHEDIRMFMICHSGLSIDTNYALFDVRAGAEGKVELQA